MRKLREAAVVAAMIGGVSMLGASAAYAGGWEHEEPKQELPTVNCSQDADRNTSTTNVGGPVELAPVGTGGDADASATQQICGIGNSDNENEAGTATGGAGTGVL